MADSREVEIPSLKEDDYFEEHGKKSNCLIWSHIVPFYEIYMQEGEYYLKAPVSKDNKIYPILIACNPWPKKEKMKPLDLRDGLITMVIGKLRGELEAANAALKQLQEDKVVSQEQGLITEEEFVNEFTFNPTSRRYKKDEELNGKREDSK
jgi:hypothetical protein